MELENLNIPPLLPLRHPDLIREPILHAGRSAALGVWLILVPAFFLACVAMLYYFHWDLGFLGAFERLIGQVDSHPVLCWLQPLLLLAAPLAAFVMNMLAVLHFTYDRARRELTINLKLRWLNLFLAAVSLLIVGIFLFYLIGEFFHHLAAGRLG